jgi:hypothetical protein
MRSSSLILLLLLGPLGATAMERDVVRTFPARPGCVVRVDTFRGAITVTEADTAEVRVAIHVAIGADDPQEAQALFDALQLTIEPHGSAIEVVARDPQQSRPRFVWNDNKQLEPTYRITVPRRCDVDVRTRNGNLIVGNIEGSAKGWTASGDVFFRHIRGNADAFTAAGDVVISHCDGALTAETRLGMVRIGVANGPCTVNNASGDVEVQEAKSDVRAYAEAGTATVTFAHDFSGRADIRTSGGPIIAALDPKTACDVDAATSWFAHVRASIPLNVRSGKSGSRRLVAAQNGGGSPIVLRASGGDVKIVRGKSLFDESEPMATR